MVAKQHISYADKQDVLKAVQQTLLGLARSPDADWEKSLFDRMDGRLEAYMKGRVYPPEIATTFNYILYDEFSKAGLKPVFVGQYVVDPDNPEQTRVVCHQGTEACSPIPIKRGVIGRAVRTGKDQHVPDVTNSALYVSYDFIHGNMAGDLVDESNAAGDSLHVSCDAGMQGSEVVLTAWSDPYADGEYKGCRVPLGVLDIDLNVKEALSEKGITRMRQTWDRWGKYIFSGGPGFTPKGELYVEGVRQAKIKEDANVPARDSNRERKLEELLKYLDKEYDIKTFYYPGSGWHKTPKKVLGKDKVVHISLETDLERWGKPGYFAKLGEGIKVKGDYRYSPFKDKSFDAVFIYGTPLASTIEALQEYRRVTAKDGLVIVVRDNKKVCPKERDNFEIIAEYLGTQTVYPGGPHLERISLPPEMERFDPSVQYPPCPYIISPRSIFQSSSPPDVVVFKNSRPAKRNQK